MNDEMITYYRALARADGPATDIQKLALRAAQVQYGKHLDINIDNLTYGEAVDYLHYYLDLSRGVN